MFEHLRPMREALRVQARIGQIDSADNREFGVRMPEPRWAKAKRRVPTLDTCLGKKGEKDALPLVQSMALAVERASCERASVGWDDAGALHPANTAKALVARQAAQYNYGKPLTGPATGTCMLPREARFYRLRDVRMPWSQANAVPVF